MEPIIKCNQLTFGYSQLDIIKDLDCQINEGDFVGIIGPNGSGKSTLLKLITGVTTPDKGTIYIKEEELKEINPKRLARQMAVVPQNTDVYYNFSTYDIVAMGRYPHQNRWSTNGEEDKAVIKSAMKKTGIWKFKDKGIKNLSGGERQRVIIARALAQEPEIIILDEPTSSLDINYQIEIFDLLKDLKKEGKTIIVVSHDLNLASQYCDKILLLSEGRVYSYGRPDQVITVNNISQVYDIEVVVSQKYSGRPYVTLVSRRKLPEVKDYLPQIHLVCGGGSGQKLINLLLEEGYPISGGVLNQGDSDWQLLLQNNCSVVEERPFSAISNEAYSELLEMIKEADITVVTDLPFGSGNLSNLKAVKEMSGFNNQIYLLDKSPIGTRDFTGGEAKEIYQELIEEGAVLFKDEESLIKHLEERGQV